MNEFFLEDATQEGGNVAGNARKELEQKSGRSVISKNNHLSLEKTSVILLLQTAICLETRINQSGYIAY